MSRPSGRVAHRLSTQDDPLVGRQLFGNVTNLFDLLRRPVPPLAMIEAEFEVPSAMTPGLQQAYDRYGLDPVKARPDLLWVRPARTGAPLIGAPAPGLAYELHVIDVKMAAEPSLRHFTEVTYYALGLAAALRQHGLAERYAVSAEGFIWPGNHDAKAFRTLYRAQEAAGDPDPVTAALLATLVPVPYEVYQVHVKHFFADRLLRVLGQEPLEASWHVGPKCQLCDYVPYCREHAERGDHLSRLPWLNQGQATLLRQHGIATTQALADAIDAPDRRMAGHDGVESSAAGRGARPARPHPRLAPGTAGRDPWTAQRAHARVERSESFPHGAFRSRVGHHLCPGGDAGLLPAHPPARGSPHHGGAGLPGGSGPGDESGYGARAAGRICHAGDGLAGGDCDDECPSPRGAAGVVPYVRVGYAGDAATAAHVRAPHAAPGCGAS